MTVHDKSRNLTGSLESLDGLWTVILESDMESSKQQATIELITRWASHRAQSYHGIVNNIITTDVNNF